ncbi:hypothetical protein C4553_00045 [Candidatus Parcubacteria bacterium]|nr:MAG: hypothetical protein C4553_00045 [Candidatus Parcubacteria bacterium]
MNSIVLDLETKKDFREIGSKRKPGLLGVSVVGIYDYTDNKYKTFEESQIWELENILVSSPMIIGFNIKGFDFLVLEPYLKQVKIKDINSVDIMEEIARYSGFRVSLDSVSMATLKQSKTASGMEALNLYKQGKIEELKDYCLNDVRLTKEIYEFGLKNKFVFIKSRDGVLDHKIPVSWSPVVSSERSSPLSLF